MNAKNAPDYDYLTPETDAVNEPVIVTKDKTPKVTATLAVILQSSPTDSSPAAINKVIQSRDYTGKLIAASLNACAGFEPDELSRELLATQIKNVNALSAQLATLSAQYAPVVPSPTPQPAINVPAIEKQLKSLEVTAQSLQSNPTEAKAINDAVASIRTLLPR